VFPVAAASCSRSEQMWTSLRNRNPRQLAAMAFGLSSVCVGLAVMLAVLVTR
jgi:hypothetical protein